jgi:para-nitrobenzyl esterase
MRNCGLFHRVIGESGGAFQPMWYRSRATSYALSGEFIGENFVTAVAGESGDTSLAALRQIPQERVLEAFESDPAFSNYDSLAIVDGVVIPEDVATIFAQGNQADVPVMIGSNANEATTFLAFFEPIYGKGIEGLNTYIKATLPENAESAFEAYPASDDAEATESFINASGDVLFAYPMRAWARSMENVTSDAYLYWFTFVPLVENSEQYRAFHAGELGYVLGNLDLFGAKPTDADYEFSDLMASIWTQFAKTGNPNGEGLPQWPAYSSDTEAYMELGVNTGSRAELRIRQMDVIEIAWATRRSNAAVDSEDGQP